PNFDEKDAGFSRFSKFVVEAAHRGLINLTKLDNGQYEIALGAGVPGAAAQPSLLGSVERSSDRERTGRRGGGGGGRRGGGGGRGRRRGHRASARWGARGSARARAGAGVGGGAAGVEGVAAGRRCRSPWARRRRARRRLPLPRASRGGVPFHWTAPSASSSRRSAGWVGSPAL